MDDEINTPGSEEKGEIAGGAADASLEEGRRIQRNRTIRVAITLTVLLLGLTAITNVYTTLLLQLDTHKAWILLVSISFGALFVVPTMVVMGIKWARPIIHFGRIFSAGRIPSIEEAQDAIKAIVLFPMRLAILLILGYLATLVPIGLVQYYVYHFSRLEVVSIVLLGAAVAFNLGMVMYFAAKQMERVHLERASAILFENGVYDIEHTRLPLRFKLLIVFFMVVTYILVSSVLMGFAQVEHVQKAQKLEDLKSWVQYEAGKGGTSVDFFIVDPEGNPISEMPDSITKEDIKNIIANPNGISLADDQEKKMIVFSPVSEGRLISGAAGYWGKDESIRQRTGKLLASLIFATILLCIAATYFVVSDINHPLKQTLNYLNKLKKGQGDAALTSYSDDEMGTMVGEVVRTTEALEERTEKTRDLLETVKNTVEGLTDTMSQVQKAGREQAAGVREQVAAVEEALSASSEILATSKQIFENAKDVEDTSKENTTACYSGQTRITESLTGFAGLNNFIREISEGVVELGEQFSRVRGIVAIIQEIAAQVDLLALNAQIEAASAGVEGRRFGVVAEEVGRLAARTVEATNEIRTLINGVNTSLQKVINEASGGGELVKSGSSLIDNMGSTFVGIQNFAEQTSVLAQGITLITRQQTSACEQLTDTIKSIHNSAQGISDNTDNVTNSMKSLDELGRKLEALLKEE